MVEELLRYFSEHARDLEWRHNPTPYRVWISEIMLQQTRVEAVKSYYERFMKELPTVEALAAVSEEKLFKLWEGLGYYSRARNLQKAAKLIVEMGSFPDTLEEIGKLPGVGPYTAGAIASIAFGLPTPAVDGNVLRVLSRIRGKNYNAKEAAAELKDLYPPGRSSDFTQSLMDLGACVCLPNGKPLCGSCPVAGECVALKKDLIDVLPEKPEKKPRKIEEKNILILEHEGRIALLKRPAKGLLAKLWSFPESPDNVSECLKESGYQVLSIEKKKPAKHIFTHVEWRMKLYYVKLGSLLPENDYVWVTKEELFRDYAVPAAYQGASEAVKTEGK